MIDLFGYELIKVKKHPSLKSHLRKILKQCQINLVLDVGANRGQFGALLRKIGYSGEIFSFEPVNESFNALQKASHNDSHWKAFKLGLSDRAGEEEINVYESSDFNSLLTPSVFGKNSFTPLNKFHTEKIHLDTLDNIIDRELDGDRKIFLKMDTQGHDLNVFRGATKSLSKVVLLLSELSFQPIYQNMPTYHSVLSEYEAAGFLATGFYPVSRNPDSSIIEMDCVMLNHLCSNQ